MKKSLLAVVLFITCTQFATAQIPSTSMYHPLRFDFGIGAATFKSLSKQSGAIIYLEPHWNLPMYKFGVRGEAAIGMYMKNETSLALTADRYFTSATKPVRPFIGGGIGLFYTSESGGCGGGYSTTQTIHTTAPLGGMIRAGIELSILRVSLEYNMVQRTYVRDYDAGKVLLGTQTYASSYFGLKAGVLFGRSKESLKRQKEKMHRR